MMYLICYDIANAPHNDYPQLLEAMADIGAVKLLCGAWIVATDHDLNWVYERAAGALLAHDRLLVADVGKDSPGQLRWTTASLLSPDAALVDMFNHRGMTAARPAELLA